MTVSAILIVQLAVADEMSAVNQLKTINISNVIFINLKTFFLGEDERQVNDNSYDASESDESREKSFFDMYADLTYHNRK